MLTLFATATAVLALLAIYQERKYRFFSRIYADNIPRGVP
mgnify:CR=1 FL=1